MRLGSAHLAGAGVTPETLDRLERLARVQSGKEFGTAVAVNPGDLMQLIHAYRQQQGTPSDAPQDPQS